MVFRPVERQSVSTAVFDQLAAEILGGSLGPGDALPAERALTEAFGVNRQAVREAVQRLDQLGLLDVRHGGATRVTDYRRRAGLDVLPMLLVRPDGSLDLSVIRSLMEMRVALGPDIARLCALRATPDVIDELRSSVAALAEASTPEHALAADERFWDALVDGSDNVAYRLSLNLLRRIYRPAEALVADALAVELTDVGAHRAVAEAVAAGRADAAERAARRLLAKGLAAVTAVLEEASS